MTDHARAALEGYGPVFEARERWMSDPTPANKATFDAVREAYNKRFDCSCPTEGPRVCRCTYTTPDSAPRSDATDTTTHSDSGDTHMTFSDYLKQANGDLNRASQLALADERRRQRDASVTTLRSDALDRDEEMRRRLRNTAWTEPLAYSTTSAKESQERKAAAMSRMMRADAAEAERRAYRADEERARFDAAAPTCPEHGKVMIEGNYGPACSECAERDFKRRQRSMWKKPLQATNQRSAGTIGYHPTDDEVA